jgi:ribonucleoside-triphosphate reductase
MQVSKRDGTIVEFDINKIRVAISKTNEQTHEMEPEDLDRIVGIVERKIQRFTGEISVEDIQDLVEDTLLKSKFNKTAKSYVLYRDMRSRNRDNRSKLLKEIAKKLNGTNIVNQNANVDEASFGGRKGEAANELMKWFALNNCVCKRSRENHLNNEIYIHDLDSYALGNHNCLSIPFDHLLANGFNTRQTDIRPASSINTAFQLVAVIFQLQSLQQFGGVAATHLDWTMVPYVRKSLMKHYIFEYLKDTEEFYELDLDSLSDTELDEWIHENKAKYLNTLGLAVEDFYMGSTKLDTRLYKKALFETRRETVQAVEGMYHNLNTLQSRSGNQLPFSSINYGTCTSPEGRMIIKALLEGCIKGVGKHHKTSIFPCGIFQYMKGVNDRPGTPNYDMYRLALESTSKRLYPNYANVDWSGNAGYDRNDPKTYFSTMGCRTANGFDINHDEGVNPQTKDGRGNLAPVTIILPTLAMEVDCDIECFMALLDAKLSEAKDMLIERYNYICTQDASAAKFMYENNVILGYKPEEGIRSALKHGTLAIGQLGLAETLELLAGCNHTHPEGMALAHRIEALFKKRIAEFKEKYKLNFGVYYTPAENLCKTAMIKFKEKYGVIEKVSDREYFTNSMHVPVWENTTVFEKIDIESELTGYSSAGCITYVELDGDCLHNIDAIEEIVNYAMAKDIPYFAINVPNDTCLDCGFTGEFNVRCPECDSTSIQQLRRVTGYLTGDYRTAFNAGKIAEAEDRVKHTGVAIV